MRFLRHIAPISALYSAVAALTYKGADISSLAIVEGQGKHFTDGGSTRPFENIMVSHGANTARIRVWTAGDYNTNYAIQMGRRVKQAGMRLIVDLHFSDRWADPGHQTIPSSWPKDLNGLNTQIYTYTKNLVIQFSQQGVSIDILQVGNEINDGLLWPVGQISKNGFSGASQLLHSSISGARDAGLTNILIHLADGWNYSNLNYFYSGIFIPGALSASDVSIVGFSFYPFYNSGATLSALKSSLTSIANKLSKPIIVAETDWPVSCSGGSLTEKSIPVSANGQETWIQDIRNVLSSLPNDLGQGILYWEPSWIGNAALGSSCADNLVVDYNGNTRTSINIFNDM